MSEATTFTELSKFEASQSGPESDPLTPDLLEDRATARQSESAENISVAANLTDADIARVLVNRHPGNELMVVEHEPTLTRGKVALATGSLAVAVLLIPAARENFESFYDMAVTWADQHIDFPEKSIPERIKDIFS